MYRIVLGYRYVPTWYTVLLRVTFYTYFKEERHIHNTNENIFIQSDLEHITHNTLIICRNSTQPWTNKISGHQLQHGRHPVAASTTRTWWAAGRRLLRQSTRQRMGRSAAHSDASPVAPRSETKTQRQNVTDKGWKEGEITPPASS